MPAPSDPTGNNPAAAGRRAGKNPKAVAAGQVGAQRRWGVPRRIRLDGLTPAQRTLILALVAAARDSMRSDQVAEQVGPENER